MKSSYLKFYLAFLSVLPLMSAAGQRGLDVARDIARKFWKIHSTDMHQGLTVGASRLNVDGASCYVAYREDPAKEDARLPGFLLISDDVAAPIVLAYDTASFFPDTDIPEHIGNWLKGYGSMARVASAAPDSVSAWLAAADNGLADIAPLLGSREWGQDNPYNLFCPDVNGVRCPSGCVATALAQIMCNYMWPVAGTGTVSYVTTTNNISINYDFRATTFRWKEMRDAYTPVVDSSEDQLAIAADSKYLLRGMTTVRDKQSSQCTVNISGLTVNGASSFSGDVVLMIASDNYSSVTQACSEFHIRSRYSGEIVTSRNIQLYVSNALPDGHYQVHCAVKDDAAAEWSLAKARLAGCSVVLDVWKEGQTFTVDGETYPCGLSVEDVQPVATLLQAVGAAVRMNYDPSGSGSNDYNALTGLVRHLRYDQDMFFATPDNFTDRQWHTLLQGELAAGRPVYYTGQGTTVGHAFVIDGMQTADDGTTYYHVNWGWDGLCNGYYLLNMLRPVSTGTGGSQGSNYSTNPSMLIGMKPEDGVSQMRLACKDLSVKDVELFASQTLSLCIGRLSVLSGSDFRGNISLVLRDKQDAAAAPIPLYQESNTIVSSSRGLTNYYLRCQIAGNTPPGTYELVMQCTAEDGTAIELLSDEWPQLTVRDPAEWAGGSSTSPMQQVAIRGAALSDGDDPTLVTLHCDSVINMQNAGAQGKIALLVCDASGRLQSVMPEPRLLILSAGGIRTNVAVSGQFSKHLPDGSYLLGVGYLPADSLRWTFACRMDFDGNILWSSFTPLLVPMQMADGNATIGGHTFQGIDMPLSVDDIRAKTHAHTTPYDLNGRVARSGGRHQIIIKDKRKTLWQR